MELSKEQERVVRSKEKHILVIASAAAGKTRTLTERVKYLLENGVDPKKMVVLTFTNHAAQEMKERLGNPSCVFIGTIHSYCAYLLSKGNVDISSVLEEERFDELFSLIKEHLGCVEEVDYLLMDESQDTTGELASFILDVMKPKNYAFFFDPRQQIYDFSGSNPERIYALAKRDDVTVYWLNDNYRNAREILNFAKRILFSLSNFYQDTSHAKRIEKGKIVEIDYDPYYLLATIPKKDSYRDWFILCRTNNEVQHIADFLKQYKIPVDTFKQGDLTKEELSFKMRMNTIKVLTIHSAKGLEAKNVVVIGARFWNEEEKRLSYVAATRARDLLIWMKTKPNRKKAKNTVKMKRW